MTATAYQYWLVNYGADLTETGCTTSRAYIRTTWDQFYAEQILRDFCREKFGREVEYVQGCSPCLNWTIHTSYREAWIRAEGSHAHSRKYYNSGRKCRKGNDDAHTHESSR